MDVGEHFGDGWAVLRRFGLQPTLRKSAEQVNKDCVVAIPGVEQNLKQALICSLGHGPHRFDLMTN